MNLEQFQCHFCHDGTSYSMLPKYFSYFALVLANCKTIGNKVGHLSEKKHLFVVSLLVYGESRQEDKPKFWQQKHFLHSNYGYISQSSNYLSSKLLPPEKLAKLFSTVYPKLQYHIALHFQTLLPQLAKKRCSK